MAADLKEKLAERLKEVINGKPVVDISGGPSRSYVYRMLKGTANPSIEELDAVVRAYGSSLPEFFLPWLTGTSLDDIKIRQRDKDLVLKFVMALQIPKRRALLEDFVKYATVQYGSEP